MYDFKNLYRKNYKNKCTFQNADSAEEKRDVIFTKLLAGYVCDDKLSVVACVACPSLNPEDVEHTTDTVKTVFPAGNKTWDNSLQTNVLKDKFAELSF